MVYGGLGTDRAGGAPHASAVHFERSSHDDHRYLLALPHTGRDLRTGPNHVDIGYDIPGMADKCIVLSRELASGRTVSIDLEPECPHLKAAIRAALNRSRQ